MTTSSPLHGQRVLVLGLGISGLSMARWCARQGAVVVVADSREAPPNLERLHQEVPQAQFVSGPLTEALLENGQIRAVFISPGLSPQAVAAVAEPARAIGLWVGGELDLFAQALRQLQQEQDYAPQVLGITGTQKQHPKNQGDNVTFRRWLPTGGVDNKWITGANVNSFAADHITTEGVTPSADTLQAVDVTATLQQYSCLYAVTDKTVDLYEDDVPEEMKRQTGERVGLLREMVRYGALKGMTNVFYGGTGNSPSTVNGTVSLNMLRKITRSLKANHAKMITSILAPSPNYATKPVEAAYLVFCSTDLEPAIRDLPGFKHVSEYGTRKPIHEQEIGSVESFRFVLSPELAANINSGAAVGATGMYSTGAANIDIYADTTDSLLGSAKIESGLSLEPDENSLVGRFYLDEAFTADDGTLSFGTDVALSSWNYDAAETDALRETMFETATGEELAALQNRFAQSAQQKLFALLSLVPQEVLQMLN